MQLLINHVFSTPSRTSPTGVLRKAESWVTRWKNLRIQFFPNVLLSGLEPEFPAPEAGALSFRPQEQRSRLKLHCKL